jgi:hypothetical protein
LNLIQSCLIFLCCFKASGDPAWKSHWWQLYLHKSWIVAICWTRVAREDAWWPHCSQRYIFLILFFGVDDSETKSYFLKFRYEKINLDSVPLLLIKLVWKNLLPSLFHSLNLKTWSCFTKSKFVLVIDHPYHIFGLWFSKVKQTRDPFLQYLNFFNKSKKRWEQVFSNLNFINESGTESRFILPYLSFYKLLISVSGSWKWNRDLICFFPTKTLSTRLERSQDISYHI